MPLKLKLITEPVEEPVNLIEAKEQVRQDSASDDFTIARLITAVREDVEDFLNRALITQTWELYLDAWPCHTYIEIPKPPLQSITSISYVDINGATATFASSNYYVDTVREPGRVYLKLNAAWPAVNLQEANGVIVRFVCGYGVASAVPARVKQAILLQLGTLYENREDTIVANTQVIPLIGGAESLLSKIRIFPKE